MPGGHRQYPVGNEQTFRDIEGQLAGHLPEPDNYEDDDSEDQDPQPGQPFSQAEFRQGNAEGNRTAMNINQFCQQI